jgi:hypothetical protein
VSEYIKINDLNDLPKFPKLLPYLATKEVQTWDCKKWEVYTLDDSKEYYTNEDGDGYSVATIKKYNLIGGDNAFLFANKADAELLCKVKIHNCRYGKSIMLSTSSGQDQCECGVFVSPIEPDQEYPEEGTVHISDSCVCGKRHRYQVDTTVIVTTKISKV